VTGRNDTEEVPAPSERSATGVSHSQPNRRTSLRSRPATVAWFASDGSRRSAPMLSPRIASPEHDRKGAGDDRIRKAWRLPGRAGQGAREDDRHLQPSSARRRSPPLPTLEVTDCTEPAIPVSNTSPGGQRLALPRGDMDAETVVTLPEIPEAYDGASRVPIRPARPPPGPTSARAEAGVARLNDKTRRRGLRF
jgi:hypothetical protein